MFEYFNVLQLTAFLRHVLRRPDLENLVVMGRIDGTTASKRASETAVCGQLV